MDLYSLLNTLLAFIVAIGILVTIHEFGHYWVARLCGVKVIRFSVGFGKPILIKKMGVDQTEYALAAIPLGGYVKMLDEREGEVAEDELPRAFNRQSVSKRYAIVAAGPIFNFLFAIIAYTLMYLNGVAGIKPYVGDIEQGSIAQLSGIQYKDLVLSVNGNPTLSWQTARLTLMDQAVGSQQIKLQLQGEDLQIRDVVLNLSGVNFLAEENANLLEKLGMSMWHPDIPPQVVSVIKGGAAEAAGLLVGDEIRMLGHQKVQSIYHWVELIQKNPGVELLLQVMRDGSLVELKITPRVKEHDGKTIGFIGTENTAVIPEKIRQQLRVIEKYGLFEALATAVSKTWQMSALTVKVLGKLVIGEASLKNLSGPITIAKYAGLSAKLGFEQFFGFLAIISISLGVLNLLPVPMLDGGHLFFYTIEIIKGSPVSETIEAMGQRVGVTLLMLLMSIAIYNDILRLVE